MNFQSCLRSNRHKSPEKIVEEFLRQNPGKTPKTYLPKDVSKELSKKIFEEHSRQARKELQKTLSKKLPQKNSKASLKNLQRNLLYNS